MSDANASLVNVGGAFVSLIVAISFFVRWHYDSKNRKKERDDDYARDQWITVKNDLTHRRLEFEDAISEFQFQSVDHLNNDLFVQPIRNEWRKLQRSHHLFSLAIERARKSNYISKPNDWNNAHLEPYNAEGDSVLDQCGNLMNDISNDLPKKQRSIKYIWQVTRLMQDCVSHLDGLIRVEDLNADPKKI